VLFRAVLFAKYSQNDVKMRRACSMHEMYAYRILAGKPEKKDTTRKI
jgi:hypothetical protein